MGTTHGKLKPPPNLRQSIQHVQQIPLSIMIIIEVGIVFFLGRMVSQVMTGGFQTIMTCAVTCIGLYFWMFFVYIMYFGGSSYNYPYVFGQVFVIFVTVFAFTTLYIYSIPEMVRIFENTVGYYWVMLFNASVKSKDGYTPINDIFKTATAKTDESYLYHLTRLNGDFFNTFDISSEEDKQLYNSVEHTNAVQNLIKTKYNVGIICWMTIATVISTFLSMEYMSAYI